MDFELRQAREKLEREQRERLQRAKAKADRERRARAEAARRREAVEASHRERRLDAARAQDEADQRMEEVMQLGKGVSFFRMFEALRYDGPGDKIKLPPSSFTELSDEGALDKGPMYFRLSKVGDRAPGASQDEDSDATCCGVLEFTAREGSVELPPHVWNNLFHTNSPDVPLIEVRYVSLPKGTYAKLKPEGVGFSDLPNHRAVLETALRNHATLSKNDVVMVNYGQLQYKLKVLELKPASSVSVLETDVEVDIEGSDSVLDDEENHHVLVPLETTGKVESGVVEEGRFRYYKFSVEEGTSEKVASGNANIEVKIEVDTGGGDTDIYVSRHPLVFPTQHRHDWSSHEMGSKILILKPRDASLVGGTYSIGVYGFKGTAKFQLSVAIKDVTNSQRVGDQASVSSSVIDADSVVCKNCKRHISSRTSLLHEAYCVRHNVVCMHNGCGVVLRKEEAANHVHCEKCGQAFQQLEMEKHMKVFHEPQQCPCGVVLQKEDMVRHQMSSCPLRLIVCRFCGDMVQAGGEPLDARDRLRNLCEHESICGSRTAPCDSCGRSVMLKDMDIHVIAVHQNS